jgi:hypothetical protein
LWGIVKQDQRESGLLFFVSFNGIIPYMGYAKNRVALLIVYHIHLPENTGFLEDLFCKTKAASAFEGACVTRFDLIV